MSSNLIFKSHHYGEIFGVIIDNSSSQSTMIWTFVSIVKTNGQYMLKNAIMICIWFWEYVLTILPSLCYIVNTSPWAVNCYFPLSVSLSTTGKDILK